jgi:LacI family transcriptional regulator
MTTIRDVAKLAGVSDGTVSRVINGAENVAPALRARVEQAINELGYHPNLQARSLRSKQTHTIALMIPDLVNFFWTTIARGVEDALQRQGYTVFLCNTDGKRDKQIQYLELIARYRADGAIFVPNEMNDDDIQVLQARDIPLVVVDESRGQKWGVDTVYSDSISGAFALTNHLIRLNHQRIGIITGPRDSITSRERVFGYSLALAQAGFPIDEKLICWGEYTRVSASYWMHQLLEYEPTITAVFGSNNEIVPGIISIIESRGLRVPDDVAVVGFDDFYRDSRFALSITVAAQSPYDMGVHAAELLLSRLQSEKEYRPRTVVLPTRLIVRGSCGSQETAYDHFSYTDGLVSGQLVQKLPQPLLLSLLSSIPKDVVVSDVGNRPLRTETPLASRMGRSLTGGENKYKRLAVLAYQVNNRELYRYVLERQPRVEAINGITCISPEDQVEFAQRIGIEMVLSRYPWQPPHTTLDRFWMYDRSISFSDFPPLTEQVYLYERFVRAVEGTEIGIAAEFASLFHLTLHAAQVTTDFYHDPAQLDYVNAVAERLMPYLVKVVQLICDRFSDALTCAIFVDALADANGLHIPETVFESIFAHRIRFLVQQAKEHGLPTILYTPGSLQPLLPTIHRLGFDSVFPAEPELNQSTGSDSFTVIQSFSASDLRTASRNEIEQRIVSRLRAEHTIFGIAGEIDDAVPYDNFLVALKTLRSGAAEIGLNES